MFAFALTLLAAQSRTVDLASLHLSAMTNGWGRPKVNVSIEGKSLTLGGKQYAKGIGAHANTRLILKLDHATSFDAIVGVDDETNKRGSVEFFVIVDGKTKWTSGRMVGGGGGKPVHVDLTGATTLVLRATDAGDGNTYDHADWADARITTLGGDPTPVRDLQPIRIETQSAALALYVDDEGHLMQRSFGAKSADEPKGQTAYPAAGDGWIYEPALRVTHADGNTSTDLHVVGSSTTGNVTKISLKDPEYPLSVDLLFETYPEHDVIATWSEVHNGENGPVTLDRFASASPDFGGGEFFLTQFHGDWAKEMTTQEEPLGFGMKILDSKIGVRADQFRNPSFLLSRGGPAKEDSGEVFAGSLAWSGSFQFAFERQPQGRLRALCGMNPYASEYHLDPGKTFATPRMVWAWSNTGTGTLSRNLHRWTRKYALREGDRPRAILLNNWEATYFDFDAQKIISLFDGAKSLGMELFLLDDGWFGRKYPRDDDTQGLGDWIPDPKKLPNGIAELTSAAKAKDVRFGLWLEPEMVNPLSELFEKHPDWAIQQPKRKLELQRNQLALDLSNPAVEAYVWSVIDRTLKENPGISYIKWDCNRYLTQPGSPYLPKDRQTHLQIDYVHALYRVMERMAKTYPNVELMICSGGGGRVDFGSLPFGHEFWPSDMTDPAKRIFIQWGYSYVFPAIAVANHVTLSGNHGMKFAFDVAMSGRLGMDVDVDKLTAEDKDFARSAITTYKGIRDVVQLGDLYRLESPYAGPRSSLMYVHGGRAVVFAYSLGDVPAGPLVLKGLDPNRKYRIREIDIANGGDEVADGATLMASGLPLPAYKAYGSTVFELTAAK